MDKGAVYFSLEGRGGPGLGQCPHSLLARAAHVGAGLEGDKGVLTPRW